MPPASQYSDFVEVPLNGRKPAPVLKKGKTASDRGHILPKKQAKKDFFEEAKIRLLELRQKVSGN